MDDQDLYKKVNALHSLLQRYCSRGTRGPAGDPTRGQGRILAMLKLQDAIPTKELSYLLGIRVTSLNELLAKLERSGLIERVPSEADRRIILIKLTDAGRSMQQDATGEAGAFGALTEKERDDFGSYLDRVIASLEVQTREVNEDAIDGWMGEARARMGEESFQQWMRLLKSQIGEDNYRIFADKLRRQASLAARRAERAGRHGGRSGSVRGSVGFSIDSDDDDFGPDDPFCGIDPREI